jgi:hypothetical protein
MLVQPGRMLPLALLVLCTSYAGFAQVTGNFGTPPRLIPYSGVLERGGVGEDNPSLPLRFCLVRNPTDSCDTPAQVLWSETQNVAVARGRFSVALGQTTALPDSVFLEPELHLGVVVGSTELTGKQRLMAAPFATTAAQAATLNVRDGARIGLVTDGPAGSAGTGARLRFSGAPDVSASWDSDNSDELWMARHNVSDNTSELRVNLGDDPGETDHLVIGSSNPTTGAFTTGARISSDGTIRARTLRMSAPVTGTYQSIMQGTSPGVGNVAQSFNAASDGTVVVTIGNADNGSRGTVEGYVNETGAEFLVARDSYHLYTNTDASVPNASITFPVRRGTSYRIVVTTTSDRTNYRAYFVPWGV